MSLYFILIERLHSTTGMSTLNTQYFTYNRKNTFKVHVHNLVTAEFLLFIKSQFTSAQNNLHLEQCTYGHV